MSGNGPGGPDLSDTIGVFYKTHYLTAVKVAICGYPWLDLGSAEDVVQEAVLRMLILMSRGELPDMSETQCRSYLLRAIRNRALNWHRRSGREVPLKGTEQPRFDSSEQWREDLEIKDAIDRLPGHSREAAALMYIGGRTVSEIAEITEVTAKTVHARLGIAERRLGKTWALNGASGVPVIWRIAIILRGRKKYDPLP